MASAYDLARKAAAGTVSVLLLGETGVGKDVLARAIHRLSPRAERPFQRIHCAALTDSLTESELYGHERGAFTGAGQSKEGLVEAAAGGTVFLDEIGELPLRSQAKLLHLLETRQATRLGAVRGRTLDVRFVAATNRDVDEDVARGSFRKDLYYRLAGLTIKIPPLRERHAEIVPLATAFLHQICHCLGRSPVPVLAPQTEARLEAHDWPGNVRELRNLIERAILLSDDDRLEPRHLLFDGQPGPPVTAGAPDGRRGSERRTIEDALAACAGNQTQAAKLLGLSRTALVARIARLGIARPRKRPAAGPPLR